MGVNGFLAVPDGFESGRSFCRRVVEEESIVLAPGECFAGSSGGSEEAGTNSPSDAPELEGYFRLGFGLLSSELEEGLSRLRDFLERHR